MPAMSTRAGIGAVLERVLLHESQLAASTREFMSRVRGSPMQSIKRLFAEQGRQIDRWVDEVGMCVRAIGGAVACATKGSAVDHDEFDPTAPGVAVTSLLRRHEKAIRELRPVVEMLRTRDPNGDAASVLAGLLEFHETTAWMLRLLLESPERARVM